MCSSFCFGSNNYTWLIYFKLIPSLFFFFFFFYSLSKSIWKTVSKNFIDHAWLIFLGKGEKTFKHYWCRLVIISHSSPGSWNMTPTVLLLILCFGVASGAQAHDPKLDAEWKDWKTKYAKSYSPVGKLKTVQKGLRVNFHCCCKCLGTH